VLNLKVLFQERERKGWRNLNTYHVREKRNLFQNLLWDFVM